MKHHLKTAINVLASLFVMVSGTMQAAQAEDVWLDFSVPEADVTLTTPAPTASVSQPSTLKAEPSVVGETSRASVPQIVVANSTQANAVKRSLKASENAAKLIALDFSVANTDSAIAIAPVASGVSTETEPSNLELKPPPSTMPSFQPPTTSAIETPVAKTLSSKTTSKQLTALRNAIVGQESAGKFNLINPYSKALGGGQGVPEIMCPLASTTSKRTELDNGENLHNNPRLCAFLDTISWAETGKTNRSSSYTYIVFRGAYAFNNFSTHPFVGTGLSPDSNCAFIKRSGRRVCSSASGRYQIMDFNFRKLKLKGWMKDFSPDNQDLAAVYLIYQKGALEDVLEGRFEKAACKAGSIWASFPCNSYRQPQKTMTQLKARYKKQFSVYSNRT